MSRSLSHGPSLEGPQCPESCHEISMHKALFQQGELLCDEQNGNSSNVSNSTVMCICQNDEDKKGNPFDEIAKSDSKEKISHDQDHHKLSGRGLKKFPYTLISQYTEHFDKLCVDKQFTFRDYVRKDILQNFRFKSIHIFCVGLPKRIICHLERSALETICKNLDITYTRRTTVRQLREFILGSSKDMRNYVLLFEEYGQKAKILPKGEYISTRVKPIIDHASEPISFPPAPPTKLHLEKIVNDWTAELGSNKISESGCMVCGQLSKLSDLTKYEDLKDIDFSILDPEKHNVTPPTKKERLSGSEPIEPLHGPVLDFNCDSVCHFCVLELRKLRIPRFALARGFWLGDIPPVLSRLSFIERLIIAKVRHNKYLIRVRSGRYKMRANAILYESPVCKVYNKLPPHKNEVDDIIACIFTGPTEPSDDDLKRIPLLVRRAYVRDALTWLKLNHEDYDDLEISEENISSYLDNQIPVSILHRKGDEETNKNPESTAVNDHEPEEGVLDGDCPFVVSGLSAEQLDNVKDLASLKALTMRTLRTDQKVLAIGRSADPEATFRNPQLYPKMFPWLFPYGFGGVGNMRGVRRSRDLSPLNWKRKLLMYHDKRFQKDRQFALIAFNHEQIKEAAFGSYLCTKRSDFDNITRRIMTVDKTVLQTIVTRLHSGDFSGPKNLEEQLCYDLINDLDIVNKMVPGSITSKKYMRNEIWSLIYQRGAPSWFITFAPPDSKSPICLYYADTKTYFEPIQRTDAEKYRLIAENPVASARYFDFMVQLFLRHILRADCDEDGLFGRTEAFYGTVEQQARLTLHLHLLLWIKNNLTPEEIRLRLASDDHKFQREMIEYLESVHKGEFLSGTLDVVRSIADERESVDASKNPLEELPRFVPPQCPSQCKTCVLCQQNEEWWSEYKLTTDHTLLKANLHKCTPYSCMNNRYGTCKARFPREIVENSNIRPNGFIELKKHERWINTYSPILTYLMRANTDVTSLLSGTAIKAVIQYVTDYITKAGLNLGSVCDALVPVFDRNTEYMQGSATDGEKARRTLMQMVNSLTSKMEIGSPMASMYLLGNPDHYTNCSFVPFYWKNYVAHVSSAFQAEDQNPESERSSVSEYDNQRLLIIKKGKRLVGYTNVLDYIYRPNECSQCSLYDWVRCYAKIRRKNRSSASKKKEDIHLLSESDMENDVCSDDDQVSIEDSYENYDENVNDESDIEDNYDVNVHESDRAETGQHSKLLLNESRPTDCNTNLPRV